MSAVTDSGAARVRGALAMPDGTSVSDRGISGSYDNVHVTLQRAANRTCEPEVISAHIPQCGSTIPRAAYLSREPFRQVGV